MMRFSSLILLSICFSVRSQSFDSNFVERLVMPDGEVVVRVHIDNKTAVRTSYSGYDLLEVSRKALPAFDSSSTSEIFVVKDDRQ
jgi:hypothetical protein